jgi:hypothetical protein
LSLAKGENDREEVPTLNRENPNSINPDKDPGLILRSKLSYVRLEACESSNRSQSGSTLRLAKERMIQIRNRENLSSINPETKINTHARGSLTFSWRLPPYEVARGSQGVQGGCREEEVCRVLLQVVFGRRNEAGLVRLERWGTW